MEGDKLIYQSNQLVLSKINLSNIYEKKLLNAFVNSVSPHLEGNLKGVKGKHLSEETGIEFGKFKTKTYVYMLSDIEPNPQNYTRLRAAIKKLRETSIDVVLEDGSEFFAGLIQSAHLDHGHDTFSVKLSIPAYQFLLDITKGYSVKSFLTSLDLKTIYASCIYELLCKWRNKSAFQIDIEELRFITNAPKSYTSYDIKRRVIGVAKKELDESEFSDLKFNFQDIKRGKKITGFKFTILHTGKDIMKQIQLSQDVSPRWDFDKEVIDFFNKEGININGKNRELLREFFKINSTSKGLEFLEQVKDDALQKSRNNPQGYIISAIKNHNEQKKSKDNGQLDIIGQLAEQKKSN